MNFFSLILVVAMVLVHGLPAFANLPRWMGENQRLIKEAMTPGHALATKIQEVIDSGIYRGEEGKRLYFRHLEEASRRLEKAGTLFLAYLSAQGKIGEELQRQRALALELGNERIAQVIDALLTDDSMTVREKIQAFYRQVTVTQLHRFAMAQLEGVGRGDVNRMFASYRDRLSKGAGLNIFCWIGNLTWGFPNSMIGMFFLIGEIIASPFFGNFPIFRVSPNGRQIQVCTPGFGVTCSLGIWEFHRFQVRKEDNFLWGYSLKKDYHLTPGSDWANELFFVSHLRISIHEGGHAQQSAILGPLYLPVVLGSYAIVGRRYQDNFIERWGMNYYSGEELREK